MVTITKIKSKLDKHPNNIEEGYSRTGFTKEMPVVGKSFCVERMGDWFITSPVTQIVESHLDMIIFETKNSTYRLDID